MKIIDKLLLVSIVILLIAIIGIAYINNGEKAMSKYCNSQGYTYLDDHCDKEYYFTCYNITPDGYMLKSLEYNCRYVRESISNRSLKNG